MSGLPRAILHCVVNENANQGPVDLKSTALTTML